MQRVVIIGCGNPLRTDDRFGLEVASRLADYFREVPDVYVETTTQLLPEHAALLRQARLTLVIDASGSKPGDVSVQRVMPQLESGIQSWAHKFAVEDLVRLAYQLHRQLPRVLVLSAGAYSFEMGEGMTPSMSELADRLAAETAARIRRLLRICPLADHCDGQG